MERKYDQSQRVVEKQEGWLSDDYGIGETKGFGQIDFRMDQLKQLLLFLFILILVNIKCTISISQKVVDDNQLRLCNNGGVYFDRECICAAGYKGSECELFDATSSPITSNTTTNTKLPCGEARDGDINIGPLCCWSKSRTSKNTTNLGQTAWFLDDNSEIVQHAKIRRLLKTYGPWDENDINYLKHHVSVQGELPFGRDRTKLVYALRYHNNTDKLQYLPRECNQENKPPLAFVMLITSYDSQTFKTLMKLLYSTKHYYVINIDKRHENDIKEIEKDALEIFQSKLTVEQKEKNYPMNIRVMDSPFMGYWGAPSLVYMELTSYTFLFDMVKQRRSIGIASGLSNQDSFTQFSHVINFSGNDMPLKSLANFESLLCSNFQTNYLQHYDLENYKPRYNTTWYLKENNFQKVDEMVFDKYDCGEMGSLKQFELATGGYGSQWHLVRYEFAYHAISDLRSIERMLSLKFTSIPDEAFFQAIKYFYPLYPNQQWLDSRRMTLWSKNAHIPSRRYAVEKQDIDNLDTNLLFVRKVYDQDGAPDTIETLGKEEVGQLNSLINWFLYSPASSTYIKDYRYRNNIARPRAAPHWSKGGIGLWDMDVRQVAQKAWTMNRFLANPSANPLSYRKVCLAPASTQSLLPSHPSSVQPLEILFRFFARIMKRTPADTRDMCAACHTVFDDSIHSSIAIHYLFDCIHIQSRAPLFSKLLLDWTDNRVQWNVHVPGLYQTEGTSTPLLINAVAILFHRAWCHHAHVSFYTNNANNQYAIDTNEVAIVTSRLKSQGPEEPEEPIDLKQIYAALQASIQPTKVITKTVDQKEIERLFATSIERDLRSCGDGQVSYSKRHPLPIPCKSHEKVPDDATNTQRA
ncbi:hypothetical protein DFA_01480 [Cavenderia fasciculata]|uniref:protein xylosyltransferase n=1 Tax=Cavenderia fasciculata TaxID=261658 RepID=F4PT18_CACFS|nr:uncharacterized protein DFA_01480 [Cavenderia fasciculata]EGG21594.1 hypothetical protein DFA_01480 [Cavenderia fasciculata]|eukprot:XP_004359444.1 hypothetical protein DFA_01480 [Cavenderia fasciculata]